MLSEHINDQNQQIVSFVPATPNLIQLNRRWQEQLKTEKERVRQNLITGSSNKTDDTLDYDTIQDAVVTLVNPINYNVQTFDDYNPILPVASIITSNHSMQRSITDEYTLNREQRAAFMIITSHLDGEKTCIPGIVMMDKHIIINQNTYL
jgi:hypothetical protein